MLWAFVATLIKATTTLTEFGVSGMFTHWPVYALAGVGLMAEILNQAALHVGPLSVSQPFIVIVNPCVHRAQRVDLEGMFSATPGFGPRFGGVRRHVRVGDRPDTDGSGDHGP